MANSSAPLRMATHVLGASAQEIPKEKYRATLTQVRGRHLWVVMVGYEVDPAEFLEGNLQMGTETMLGLDGPCCYWCGRSYTVREMARYCRGVLPEVVSEPPRKRRRWRRRPRPVVKPEPVVAEPIEK